MKTIAIVRYYRDELTLCKFEDLYAGFIYSIQADRFIDHETEYLDGFEIDNDGRKITIGSNNEVCDIDVIINRTGGVVVYYAKGTNINKEACEKRREALTTEGELWKKTKEEEYEQQETANWERRAALAKLTKENKRFALIKKIIKLFGGK